MRTGVLVLRSHCGKKGHSLRSSKPLTGACSGLSGKVSTSGPVGAGLKPRFHEDSCVWTHRQIICMLSKRPPVGACAEVLRGVPAHRGVVLASDCGSNYEVHPK
ncbi:hypothetical protein AVEN_153745-1 [Araneus ventricosus]|uniref:Uncharacterized protein n=1 Tax=Araneus ventricosus TaxID=182803 RepID=A0A4Y2LIV9_ARAVE|nr:hypothetical protein AVEN_153745-1 [Araneus ventricosus]